VVLVITHGFTDAALGGGPAEVQCIADGADAITASQAIGLLWPRAAAMLLMELLVTTVAVRNLSRRLD
jgi:hypothetical protein